MMKTDLLSKPIRRQKPPRERLTYNEFCTRVNEQKADLIHWEIIVASPARFKHEDFVNFWTTILRLYVKRKKPGIVVGSRYAMKFSEHEATEPDIMFIKKEREHLMGETEISGPADLVIEVVSPGSRRLDFVEKSEVYAKYGVPEFWLIDLFRQRSYFRRNINKNREDLHVDDKGNVRSEMLSGFWLRKDWLFADEDLDELDILETILAGE